MVIIWTNRGDIDDVNQDKEVAIAKDYVNSVSNSNNSVSEAVKLDCEVTCVADSAGTGSASGNLHVVNAVVHSDGDKDGAVSSGGVRQVDVDMAGDINDSRCNGEFKNGASHVSYNKHARHKVDMLLHRHTL